MLDDTADYLGFLVWEHEELASEEKEDELI
jgi:hypothetical protein